MNLLNPPPPLEQNSWVRHWYKEKYHITDKDPATLGRRLGGFSLKLLLGCLNMSADQIQFWLKCEKTNKHFT